MRNFNLVFVILLVWIPLAESCGRGSITISNNGYKNILVSVAERVEPNNEIIDKLKEAFTEASAFLFQATRFRAYFQNITILLPNTWPDDPSYQRLSGETADKSDIVVDLPEDGQGNRPFTIKTTPCGEPGYYMHLTPDFLLDEQVAAEFGEYGRVLVHEWAHLRYGVFNEYPSETGGQHFYADFDGYIEGTRCSNTLSGALQTLEGQNCQIVNGLPEPDCRFVDEEGLSGSYASIMYRTNLDHLAHFCDNDTEDELTYHNYMAPNEQNIMCGERSVWEVLRLHPDFADGANPPADLSTVPTFKIVRESIKQTVLVLDTSGSMAGVRLSKMNQGCSTFISSVTRDGERMGIVTFAAVPTIQQPMITVSNTSRQTLLDGLPTGTGGGTSIGGGIRSGLQVLTDAGVEAGILIVVSDGEENTDPTIEDVTAEVLASGVTLHAIAITDDADSALDVLAQATGGLSFIYSENDNSNAINEAFRTIGELNTNPSEQSYPLYSRAVDIGQDVIEERVVIDETLGRDTQFIFDYSQTQGLSINLRSPSGNLFDTSSPECEQDRVYFVYRFTFPGVYDTGAWSFNVSSLSGGSQTVSITVVSKPNTPGDYPIVAQAFWGSRNLRHVTPGQAPARQTLHASVSKGYIPVLRANVVASIQPPQGTSIDVILKDDGAGADLFADDGIYSTYFIRFNGDGRYGVTVSVNSDEATVISPIRIIGQGAARGRQRSDPPEDQPTGDFQRLASGGSFELADFQEGVTYPPGRIQDFRLTEVDWREREVSVEWTAVGAELDQGTLTEYVIRYSNNFDELRNNFTAQRKVTQDMVVSDFNITSPQVPGAGEHMRIVLPESEGFTFYVAIRGMVDDESGPISNIISATMQNIEDDQSNLPLILGLSMTAALLVIIAVIVLVFYVLPKRMDKETLPKQRTESATELKGITNIGQDVESAHQTT